MRIDLLVGGSLRSVRPPPALPVPARSADGHAGISARSASASLQSAPVGFVHVSLRGGQCVSRFFTNGAKWAASGVGQQRRIVVAAVSNQFIGSGPFIANLVASGAPLSGSETKGGWDRFFLFRHPNRRLSSEKSQQAVPPISARAKTQRAGMPPISANKNESGRLGAAILGIRNERKTRLPPIVRKPKRSRQATPPICAQPRRSSDHLRSSESPKVQDGGAKALGWFVQHSSANLRAAGSQSDSCPVRVGILGPSPTGCPSCQNTIHVSILVTRE